MNIKQAKEEIIHTVKAYLKKDVDGSYKIPSIRQRPVLLMGPPGIGKTQIMEQIASECRIGLVSYTLTHHTRQSAVGLPMIKQEEFEGKTYSITEYTMSEIIAGVYKRIRDYGQKEGILFIDEINCVSETLTPTMLQFLQCKSFGNQKVPEGWIIVAAGNPPEYNKSVKDFDMVTLDRVRYINIEADLQVWRNYAVEHHIHNAILSYLELRPAYFYKVEADVDGLKFVTARGWEDLSSLMKVYEELKLPVTEEIVKEFIRNDEIAQDAAAYFALYQKYRDDYGIPEILKGQVKPTIYQRIMKAGFDEKLSVVQLLLDGLGQMFVLVYWMKRKTDLWYEFLKELQNQLQKQNQLDQAESVDLAECFNILLNRWIEQFHHEKNSGYLSKEEIQCRESLTNMLQKTAVFVRKSEQTADSLFDVARTKFTIQTEKLAQAESLCLNQIEHAFDFMEDVFTSGQEMLIFITGLTMGKESASFLMDHVCERYLKYNEELMAGSRKAELLKELEQ